MRRDQVAVADAAASDVNEQQLRLQREAQDRMCLPDWGSDELCTTREYDEVKTQEAREPRPLQYTKPLPPLPPNRGENADAHTDANIQSDLDANPPNNTPAVIAAAHIDVEVHLQGPAVAATANVNDMTASEAAYSSDIGTVHSAAAIPTTTDAAAVDSN